jgi:putative ABC transport system substrate-binding protein
VFATGADPVKLGLVSSFNRPGGNATGVYFTVNSLGSKRLEFLRELVPHARTVGILINPDNPTGDEQKKDMQAAATAMGLQIIVVEASRERDIDMAFAAFIEHRATAVVVGADAFFLNRQHQLIALAARHALPAMYHLREMTVAGGLMSYGPDITDAHRLAGTYAGRVLKGEKPADMPVIQPTKFDLVINLKTAKALGLEIPPKLLALSDEVIE